MITAAGSAPAAPTGGYLDDSALSIIKWTPPAPALDSPVNLADLAAYFTTRNLIGTPRGQSAQDDDVYLPPDVAPRFAGALGVSLTKDNAPLVLAVVQFAQKDLEALVKPVKKPRASGGRTRPYVQYPDLPACPHDVDDQKFGLAGSGSYPSTHAAVGWIWGAVLAELAPDKADAVIARGLEFGDSRLVCGFHYPSDLANGRLAAAALLARLHADPKFQSDMVAAKAQLDAARAGVKTDPLLVQKSLQKTLKARVVPQLVPDSQ